MTHSLQGTPIVAPVVKQMALFQVEACDAVEQSPKYAFLVASTIGPERCVGLSARAGASKLSVMQDGEEVVWIQGTG